MCVCVCVCMCVFVFVFASGHVICEGGKVGEV